jgi:ABC-type sugar transport system substrate-binding protein
MQEWSKGRIARTAGCAAAIMLLAANAQAADKVGVSMPNIKGPWFTPILFGISDDAKKLGYEIIIQDAGGYGNVDKQVSQFSNLVVQQVKAILLDPANPDSFNGAVRQAKAAKIPVAILAGPPGAFWASDRLRCFKEDIANSNLKIVAEQTSEQDAAVALSLANDFLQRFPNVDLLYGADDTYGVGAGRAAQGAQKCGKVKVLFAVLGEAAEEIMRAGCADYVVAQQPVLIGRTAIGMVDKLVKGQPLAKKLEEIALIPVTKANLDSISKTTMQAPKGWTP